MTTAFLIRIIVAALLGGLIGLEREYRAKEAGFRTHFLVALGSAVFMILSQYGFEEVLGRPGSVRLDPSRIAAQVVSGIGFIGAGTIILQKHMVKGLTTAAGLWVTSAIGMAAGAGMFFISICSTLLVLLCLEALNFILHRFGWRTIFVTFRASSRETIQRVLSNLYADGVEVDTYSLQEKDTSTGKENLVTMNIKVKRRDYDARILDLMGEFEGVTIENLE